ncbi:glycerophosphodiester phosphodiesterase [Glaciecola sp. SC05]|uniref:glycerophosphodiester phosphodiesterase n=1 Tax=Glaciecola sp. SC05 TaxID=1987355 RepID=UPI003528CB8F
MLAIAHRGLSAHFPENTVIAFEKAIQAGARALECDVHQVENTFIIFHDFYLHKLTGNDGALATTSMQTIEGLRIKGSEHKIPKLQDVFKLTAGRLMLNLELKRIDNAGLFVDQLCELVRQYEGDHDELDIVLSSFDHPMLQNIKAKFRDTPLSNTLKFAALIGHLPISKAQYAVDMQADIAAIDADLVDAEFVAHAKQNYLDVWCYTVNHEDLLLRLIDMRVDGIFCDDVSWAEQVIEKNLNCQL